MFDTINFSPAIPCGFCGKEISDLQTKEFDCAMATFKIGSVLSSSPVVYGIIREELWCDSCRKEERGSRTEVFLIVWHSVLAGVERNRTAAEARLASVDRLDLLRWLDEAQKTARNWFRRHHALARDLESWRDHLAREANPLDPSDEATARRRTFERIWALPDEILGAPDPLTALIDKHEAAAREADDAWPGGLW